MTANDLNKAILKLCAPIAILFRNNRGKGWIGKGVRRDDGSVVIHSPRWIEFGLFNGAGDVIGWSEKTITADMVGMTVAIFTSVEGKINDDLSDDQERWIAAVKRSGGIAGVARSAQEARALIDKWPDQT